MTESKMMADLIKKLQAIRGPDQSVDVAIWFEYHPDREYLWASSGLNAQRALHTDRTLWNEISTYPDDHGFRKRDHNFTESVHAVVDYLLPVNWGWRVSAPEARNWGLATVSRSHPTNSVINTEARNPAIALCIAALKAREVETV